MKFRNAVIVDGMRSPFANYRKGKFAATRMDEAGAKVVRALLDRNPKVKDTMIEDFGIGMGGGGSGSIRAKQCGPTGRSAP